MERIGRKVNNREKEITRGAIDVLVREIMPSKIILFGSRAKGENGTHADFDFAVDSPKPDISVERKIREKIEDISGLYKIDVVYLNDVDAEFKKIILKTGKVVYER